MIDDSNIVVFLSTAPIGEIQCVSDSVIHSRVVRSLSESFVCPFVELVTFLSASSFAPDKVFLVSKMKTLYQYIEDFE